jgi:hypothetical protein
LEETEQLVVWAVGLVREAILAKEETVLPLTPHPQTEQVALVEEEVTL